MDLANSQSQGIDMVPRNGSVPSTRMREVASRVESEDEQVQADSDADGDEGEPLHGQLELSFLSHERLVTDHPSLDGGDRTSQSKSA